MAYALTTREPSMKQALALSLGLHLALAAVVAGAGFFEPRGSSWGGPGGGAISVGLVRSVGGVPLPRPDAVTTSRVVDETRGLYKSEPRKEAKPQENAKALREFGKKQPKIVSRPSKILEDETPPPPNAVPYGAGGTPTMP
jgi:hypothetical protein